jgi:hypothetical protein
MTEATPSSSLGRHVFGVVALATGLITLVWHDYNDLHPLRSIVYAAAAAQIFGGAAIQFHRTTKTDAIVLGAANLVFALLCVPQRPFRLQTGVPARAKVTAPYHEVICELGEVRHANLATATKHDGGAGHSVLFDCVVHERYAEMVRNKL